MANNTETYWEANGQSLHTFARSIESLSGLGPPPLRGQDITIPFQSGDVWTPKMFGANTLTLAMWLRGLPESAGPGSGGGTKAQYQSNWNDLLRLLWTPGRQVSLRKRFYDGNILRQATALAEYAGGLQPSLIGNNAAKCTVDMSIARGVFFHDVVTTVPLVNGNNVIQVLGNAPTTNIEVVIQGARTNTKVRNSTLGVEFTYPRALNSGLTATIDVDNYKVVDTSQPSKDMATAVIHSGGPQWLTLYPGENIVNLSSLSGIGTVTLRYRAAWV